ncbi:MAG: substrate-binding domain-containing protein, partial [Pseudomonadota bacterium]
RLGQAGDVDAVLVHAPDAEKAFVAEGHAPYRRPIMYNTFVIVGPATDPASVVDQSTAADAFAAIAGAQAPFVSRGDESGTHQKELDLWSMAAIRPEGRWYRSVGAGMGAALNIAAGMDAYLLTDKASWLNFGNKAGLQLIFEGDPALFNQYAYLPIPAGQGGRDARQSADALEVWLVSARGQDLIDGFEIAGQAVFVANASQTVPAKSP